MTGLLTILEQASTPATPSAGYWKLYPKSGGLYLLDDAGTEVLIRNTSASAGTFTQITVNDAAADLDSRFEGIGDANLIYTDAGNNRVGMGTSAPDGKLHVMAASAGTVTAPTGSDVLTVENSTTGGISILTPDANEGRLNFGVPSDSATAWIGGFYNAGAPYIRFATGGTVATRFDLNEKRLKVGDGTAASGTIHALQASATGAIPPLYLQQADVSEDMIELNCTIGTGNAIEAVGAKTLTTTHFVKVTITGVGDRYFPVGTIA